MDVRFNKPRVFLSHSKADIAFVQRLYDDLRHSQVEPWLDSEDIRHGRPWLDAIFEGGIPQCDAIICYFTPTSLQSTMVKKEMDAAILQQLKDRGVAFLPYVIDSSLRSDLRADIQALQCPVWNEANYEEMLPRAVSEIWRSFLERTVAASVQDERVKRLEAELELSKLQNSSDSAVFTPSEDADFSHIWDSLDRLERMQVEEKLLVQDKDGQSAWHVVNRYSVAVRLSNFVAMVIKAGFEYSNWDIQPFLSDSLTAYMFERGLTSDPESKFEVSNTPNIIDELLMYGLLERIYEPPRKQKEPFDRMSGFNRPIYRHVWSPKSFRLRYWLAFRDELPSTLAVESIDGLKNT